MRKLDKCALELLSDTVNGYDKIIRELRDIVERLNNRVGYLEFMNKHPDGICISSECKAFFDRCIFDYTLSYAYDDTIKHYELGRWSKVPIICKNENEFIIYKDESGDYYKLNKYDGQCVQVTEYYKKKKKTI